MSQEDDNNSAVTVQLPDESPDTIPQQTLQGKKDANKAGPHKQFFALFIKQAILQWRMRWTNVFIIFVPIIMICLAGIMQAVANALIPEIVPMAILPAVLPSSYYPANFTVTNMTQLFQKYYFTAVGNESDYIYNYLGSKGINQTGTGLLRGVNSINFITKDDRRLTVPHYIKQNNSANIDDQLLTTLNFLAGVQPRSVFRNTPEYLYSLPDAIGIFKTINRTHLEYTVQANDNTFFQRYSYVTSDSAINMNRARFVSITDAAYVKNITGRQIASSVGPLPLIIKTPVFDIILVVTAALMPAAISFLMPIFSYTLVMEKEKKLREMMKIMGMNGNIYWLVNYLFDFGLYILVCLAFIIVQLMFQARLFMQTSPLLMFLLFFIWGQTLIAAGFLISTVFTRSSGASLFGYLLNILSIIAAFVLCLTVYDINTMPAAWFWIYPYFCFFRVVYVMVFRCLNLNCVTGFDYSGGTWYGGEIGLAFFCLSIETIIMAVLAWYFNRVIPQEFGIADHPLFFLKPVKRLCLYIGRKLKIHACLGRCIKTTPEAPITVDENATNGLKKHPSVLKLETDIAQGKFDNEPLILEKLYKRYKGGKVALRGLTFAVRLDECYGLLGPNGAGKSTMMSILYGLFPPTSGNALVAGYDLKHIPDIQRNIGVSMQFDVLWDTMTVSEHLIFYARLKGVPNSRQHVKDLIEAVSLEHKANAYAGSLSGGMKRRLSLAIAMIGSPTVVFLDEPTTGLDPQSKRHVWKCISAFQKGRAMVLTTHDMDEASALCKRYGMLCNGELRFDGSQEELRRAFMHLYRFRLDVTFEHERRDDVIRYVMNLAPGEIKLIDDEGRQQSGKMSFGLSKNVPIAIVWTGMDGEEAKTVGGVKEWALGQMDMETLFIKLVQQEAENDKKRPPAPPTIKDRILKVFKKKKGNKEEVAIEMETSMGNAVEMDETRIDMQDSPNIVDLDNNNNNQ